MKIRSGSATRFSLAMILVPESQNLYIKNVIKTLVCAFQDKQDKFDEPQRISQSRKN
jgi:hypothetical protein